MFNNFKNQEIVIYDSTGSEIILPYIKNFKYVILETRNSKNLYTNNLYFLFQYLIKLNIRNFKQSFIIFCLKKYNPKIIVTFIDNDINFFKISSQVQIKTLLIQNGRRTKSLDVFGIIDEYKYSNFKVDFQLVFNKSMCEINDKYICGKKIEIGSFKSNSISINKNKTKKILFLSSFSNYNNSNCIIGNHFDGSKITYDKYFNSESIVLPSLNKWLLKNKLSIDILPRLEKCEQEIGLYTKFFKNANFKILNRDMNSYNLVDLYDLIINIDSTLGYEAIGRGKKVFFISNRSEFLKDDSYNFGWPFIFTETGPFWLSKFNEDLFHQLLTKIYKTEEEEWVELNKNYYQILMSYDNNNKIFTNTIEKLINN